jgi:hypothetical protein
MRDATMNRTVFSALILAACCHAAAAGEISSAYTDIDAEKTCSVFSANEDGSEFANLACNGWQGYPVLIYSGDLRESVFYGFPPDGDLAPAWESFSAFNSTGSKIEWRVETHGSRSVPFATIHRWFVSADAENPEKQTEVLVVEKVGQIHERDGCAVGLVLATGSPKANDAARKIADEKARSFVCGVDQRVIVGDVPDFTRSD